MDSACISFISSSNAAYTILWRLSEPSPSNASETIRSAKCDSPSSPLAPACPACCEDSSIISRCTGANAARNVSVIRRPTGPRCRLVSDGAVIRTPSVRDGPAEPAAEPAAAAPRSAASAAAWRFIIFSILTKPLLRPGVSDWARPAAWINLGSMAWIWSFVHPDSPLMSSAARPLVNCESDSPTKSMVPSGCIEPMTYTVDRQPWTLLASTARAASIGASFFARKSSCWYRSFWSGTILKLVTTFSSSGVRPRLARLSSAA
mmetsp:Transcript_18163/g.59425  ORF Transcript_18163/g.59425 Transcript_18163/m.59425 type:complete len:262 (-) Transcript_18163:136-921(-)